MDVEAVDHRVGEHAVDGGELTHQPVGGAVGPVGGVVEDEEAVR